jgi:hypothetical protein
MNIEDIKEKALEVLLRYGTHSPIIFVSGTKADAMILLDELPDGHFEGRKYLFRKGAETARANTIGLLREAYLVSEAWVSVGKPGDTKPVAPVKDPQRTEALVVCSIYEDEDSSPKNVLVKITLFQQHLRIQRVSGSHE